MKMYTWTLYYTYTKNGKSSRRTMTINAPSIGRAFQILRHKVLRNPEVQISNVSARQERMKEEG